MTQKRAAVQILWVVLALGLWQCIALATNNSRVAPSMGYIVRESYPSFAIFGNSSDNNYAEATRVLSWHAFQTLKRALWGIVVGGLTGVGAGLTVFSLRVGRSSARILLVALMNVPLFSLIPLFVYWFSGREFGIVLYVVLAIGILVAAATYEAATNLPLAYFWRASLAGEGHISSLRSIVLPALIPELLLTFRWVIGLTWAFTLGAEYLSSRSSGCGFLAYESYLYADVGKLLVLGTVYAILGYSSVSIFNIATSRLLPQQFLALRR